MDRKVGTIYETTNYDQFKYVEGNRPVITKGAKYNELKRSIEKTGQLVPALVTRNMEVEGGQHRLEVCKELGIPYRYTFGDKNVTAENIAAANSSKNWGLKDYVNFHARQTSANAISYRLIEALIAEFDITLSALLRTISRSCSKNESSIREGTYTLTYQKYEEVRKCLRDLTDLGFAELRKRENFSSRPFWIAMSYAWRHPMVNMSRMIGVMNKNAYRIPNTTKPTEMLRAVSEVYNYRLEQKNKVYLDVDFNKGEYVEWASDNETTEGSHESN